MKTNQEIKKDWIFSTQSNISTLSGALLIMDSNKKAQRLITIELNNQRAILNDIKNNA